MRALHLYPQPNRAEGTSARRSCLVRRADDGRVSREDLLWFELSGIDDIPPAEDCESYLLTLLMDAMSERRDLFVHGAVSRELLSNLVEFRDVWSLWCPEKFSAINIEAEDVLDDASRSGRVAGAVCAFSGGVDATFSVWRHHNRKLSYRSQAIKACAMVHGFDIPLDDEAAYGRSLKRSQDTLARLGIPVVAIRTNFRLISDLNWEHVFAAAIVGALNNLKQIAGRCLVGSSEPYDDLRYPWGSTPITDHLLGSETFRVMHDGASFSRTRKVLEIAEWPEGVENLRVCWEGPDPGSNCGVCEKCLRTKMNFVVNRLEIPACFPDRSLDLGRVVLKNDCLKAEWNQLLRTARDNGVDPGLVRALARLVEKPAWFRKLAPRMRA